MKESEHIAINLVAQENISGSQEYSICLNVTNISGKPINDLQTCNTLSAGQEIGASNELPDSNLSELEDKKRRIIKELEIAVENAYNTHSFKKHPLAVNILMIILEAFNFYASIFSRKKSTATTPYWAKEALKIEEWDDVERLEKDVISFENEDSFLKTTYLINKDKLRKVLAKLEKEQNKDFSKGISIPAGSTVSFPFSFKAPHLFKHKKMDVAFRISYKIDGDIVHSRSITERISLLSSAFAVPTGGMIGAFIGYIIKSTLVSTNGFSINWGTLTGSVVFGLIISLLVSRKPGTTKAITVEDFIGGLIIGALTGLYSDSFISKLQALI